MKIENLDLIFTYLVIKSYNNIFSFYWYISYSLVFLFTLIKKS